MIKKTIKDTLRLLSWDFSTICIFELIHKLLGFIIILPLISRFFNVSLEASGLSYLSVKNVLDLFKNPIAIVLIIALIFIVAFYTYFEFAAIILYLDDSYHKRKVSLINLINRSIEKSFSIFRFKNILLLLYVVILIPIAGFVISSGFIGQIKIPEFIVDFIKESNNLHKLYVIFFLILNAISLSCIFSLHEFTLSNKSYIQSFKSGFSIFRKNSISIIVKSVTWILSYVIALTTIYAIVLALLAVYVRFLSNGTKDSNTFITYSVIASSWMILIFSIITPIFNLAIVSNLYYKYTSVPFREFSLARSLKRDRRKIKGIKLVSIIILLALNILVSSFGSKKLSNTPLSNRPVIIGHRIASMFAPENTLAAFDELFKSGAQYAEIDVQQTKDKKLILLHDNNFKRTTGVDKYVWESTLEEVKTYDAGS